VAVLTSVPPSVDDATAPADVTQRQHCAEGSFETAVLQLWFIHGTERVDKSTLELMSFSF